MSDKLNLVKDVFVPIVIAVITMKLTTEHDKKIKKENYKIELYYIYENFRELLEEYYNNITINKYGKLSIKEKLNYKEVISRFNTFISSFKSSNKLTLKETKALLDFIYNIDSLENRFYEKCSLLTDKSKEAILIESGLNKIYNFLCTEEIEEIVLYSTNDIKKRKEKKYGVDLQNKLLEKKQIELNIKQLEKKRLEILNTNKYEEEIINELEEEIRVLTYAVKEIGADIKFLKYQLKINPFQ